jgi:2-dehydropantoate 2-reductase
VRTRLDHQVFDVVFLVTKAYDTRWHAELIKPYLPDGFLIDCRTDDGGHHCRWLVRHGRWAVSGCRRIAVPGQIKRNTAPDRTWFARQLSPPRRAA